MLSVGALRCFGGGGSCAEKLEIFLLGFCDYSTANNLRVGILDKFKIA
jgi:hypothetical protein